MLLQLLIATPHGGEERVVLEHDEYILGRDPTVSIPLRDRKVSRQHARIFRRGNAYFIEDMGSVNGVLAGGVAIQSPMKLAPGVELDVGGFILTLLAEQSGRHLTFMFTGRTAPFAGQEFLLPEGDLEVGRVDGNAIVIPDPSVSRNHAQVTVSEHSVIVEDLGSSNGTLINGERITSRTLAHGDVVSFGNVEFEFQTGGGASDHSGPFFQQLLASTNTIRLALGLAGATTVALIGALALELGPWSHAPRAPIGARELEYERSIDEALKKAERAAQAKDWSLAKTNYDAVLSQDPVNVAARDGLRSVNFNRQHAAVVEVARRSLDQRNYRAALDAANQIPTVSAYSAIATEVAEEARSNLAKRLSANASETCGKQEWARCHSAAVEATRLEPERSTVVLPLIDLAEDAMKRQEIAFTPYEKQEAGANAQLFRKYQQASIREAVMYYIDGELDAAVRRLEDQDLPPSVRQTATELSSSIESIKRELNAASLAEQQGNIRSALGHWESALATDSRIVPKNQPSTTRRSLARRVSDELFTLGESAFQRGMYADAFQHWVRGERIDDTNPQIQNGLTRLDTYGERILADLRGKSAANCALIREVLSTTRTSSSLNIKARASIQKFGCKL